MVFISDTTQKVLNDYLFAGARILMIEIEYDVCK